MLEVEGEREEKEDKRRNNKKKRLKNNILIKWLNNRVLEVCIKKLYGIID